jgi:hypothetical protein
MNEVILIIGVFVLLVIIVAGYAVLFDPERIDEEEVEVVKSESPSEHKKALLHIKQEERAIHKQQAAETDVSSGT